MAALTLAAHLVLGFGLFGIARCCHWLLRSMDSAARRPACWFPAMLLAAAFGIPGGMLVARIGVKRSQLIGWIAMAVLALSFLAPNFAIMLSLRLAYGLGTGIDCDLHRPFAHGVVLPERSAGDELPEYGYGQLGSGPGRDRRGSAGQLTDWENRHVPVRGGRTDRRRPVAGGGSGCPAA